MPKDLSQKLKERGWDPNEIESTLDRIYSEESQKKHEIYKQKINPIIYWTVLLVSIIANFVFSVAMVPFFMVLTSIQLYVVLGATGLVVGMIFNLLIRELENVDYKHHIMGGVILPVIAEVTIVVMVRLANSFSVAIESGIHQSQLIISIVYVISFMTPYLIYKSYDIMGQRKWKKKNSVPPQMQQPDQSQIAVAPPIQPGL